MEYKQFLKTETWKKQKNKTTYWHGKRCAICNSKKVDIHHKTYKAGWGNEDPKYHLIPLCRIHHYEVHDYAKEKKIGLYQATEILIKQKKPKKKLKWKDMSPFQRDNFLGKVL